MLWCGKTRKILTWGHLEDRTVGRYLRVKFLVFQHIDCEHPGSLRMLLDRAGIEWDVVALDRGDEIPELEGYDALWVLGGPMDVWDTQEHPWLVAEKEAIRRWVQDLKRPYLGLCLGHQLLADALGGTCGLQVPPEVGVYDIALTADGVHDPLFKGLEPVQKCVQWHGVRVEEPPQGAVILAGSDACPIQAMRVGQTAWSMQYHVEVEPDTVANWAKVPAYHRALMETLGAEGYGVMERQAAEAMDVFLASAETIFDNFVSVVRQ